jgi:uncharacterized protein with PQ loop repeat
VGFTDIAGAAAVVSSLAFVWPQVVRLLRTRDPQGISALSALWAMGGFSLWTAYGLDRHLYPIVIANGQALIGFAIVLVLRCLWGDPVRSVRTIATAEAITIVVYASTASSTAVGIAAILVGATSFLPQAYVALRALDVAGVSAATYTLLTLSASLWILYGVLRRDALIIAPNLLIVPTAALIAVRARLAPIVEIAEISGRSLTTDDVGIEAV